MSPEDRRRCETAIGYSFRDGGLLLRALTHASTGLGVREHNERLEFLGDSVLALVVAESLHSTYPEESEGLLTERKSVLVSRQALSTAAARIGLAPFVRVGKGIPRNRPLPASVLADVLEAILGAIYLDGGLEAARRVALDWLRPAATSAEAGRRHENHKKILQHYAQRRFGKPPLYRFLETSGPDFGRSFKTAAELDGRVFPPAWGKTKREAEQWAAREAILALEAEGERLRG